MWKCGYVECGMCSHLHHILGPALPQYTPAPIAVGVAPILCYLGVSRKHSDFVIIILGGAARIKLEVQVTCPRKGHCLLELVVVSHRMDGLHDPSSGPWGRDAHLC